MKVLSDITMLLKVLLISFFIIFAIVLIFYTLSALSLASRDKNAGVMQTTLLLLQHFILPLLFYMISAFSLIYSKTWAWGFIIIGGIAIILSNLTILPLRFIHIGIYGLALFIYLLER